ncbi:uncharacterized protein METZ01_LOCUS311421, partial [marine metagenome]
VERAKGIEPSCEAWKASVLPLNYTRNRAQCTNPACVVNPSSLACAPVSSLLLKGGRLIDPANGRDETADLLLADGKVAAIGADAPGQAPDGTPEIDATGKVVCPGLIDIHVHFREPGQTAKETIGTGAA